MTSKAVAREYKYNGNTCGERRHTFGTHLTHGGQKRHKVLGSLSISRPRFHVLSSNFGLIILQE